MPPKWWCPYLPQRKEAMDCLPPPLPNVTS